MIVPSSARVEVGVGHEVRDDLAHARRDRRAPAGAARGSARRGAGAWPATRGAISAATSSTVVAQVDAARLDLELAGLDARDVEQVVDELDEPVGRLQRDADELALALGEVLVARSSRSSSMKPLIDVSGLRSSCDAVATKSLLACSRRARSVMSRSVQTTPPSGPPRRAAVTASVRSPSRRTVTSPRQRVGELRAAGCPAPCASAPTRSCGTSSLARGFSDVTRSPLSQMTRPSPRLSIVVARRWRWASTRALAVARSAPIDVEATAERPRAPSARRPRRAREVAGGHPPRRADEVVQRAAHRADQQREEGEHGDEREPGAEPDREQRRARAVAWRCRAAVRRGAPPGASASALHGAAHGAAGRARRARARRRRSWGARRARAACAAAGAIARGQRAAAARPRRRARARAPAQRVEAARGARRRSARRGASAAARGWPPARPSRTAGWPPRPRARTSATGGPRTAGGRRRAPRSRSRR